MRPETRETVLLSLGSNIEPRRNLPAAVELLADRVQVLASSRVFETLPVGGGAEVPFLNSALEISCDLEPVELKYEVLRPLESDLGRVRTDDPNAPRTIDVDISLFGQRVLSEPAVQLEIPDPDVLKRAHVAIPLADVAPSRVHPVANLTLAEIAAALDSRGIRLLGGLVLWPLLDTL